MKKNITIINLGINNIKKISEACEYAGANVKISKDRKDIQKSDKILLPGLGTFGAGMFSLNKMKMIDELYNFVLNRQKPIFGICLGMQIFFETSEENIKTKGLGFFKGNISILKSTKNNFINIPHIGRNKVILKKKNKSKVFKKIFDNKNNLFYFIHSYCNRQTNLDFEVGKTIYGLNNFCSAIEKNNILGTQFHPELSGYNGLKILKNFIEL